MYSMRGRAGAEGLGRVFGTSPCGKGGSAPHFTFAHQLRGFQCPLQKANGPVPDPEPFPRRSIGPTTGARGMSIYPRRGPINTDDLWAAINPPQPKVGK